MVLRCTSRGVVDYLPPDQSLNQKPVHSGMAPLFKRGVQRVALPKSGNRYDYLTADSPKYRVVKGPSQTNDEANLSLFVSAISSCVQVLSFRGAPHAVLYSYIEQTMNWYAMGFESRLSIDVVDYCSYLHNFFTSYLLSQKDVYGFMGRSNKRLLDPPNGAQHLHWSGKFWRWIRPRLLSVNKSSVWLCQSLYKAKTNDSHLSESVSFWKYFKHAKNMQKEHTLPTEISDHAISLIRPILDQLATRVAKSFSKTMKNLLEPTICPKFKACLERKYVDGGSLSYILEELFPSDLFVPTIEVVDEIETDGPSDLWECHVCETINHMSESICQICFVEAAKERLPPPKVKKNVTWHYTARAIAGLGLIDLTTLGILEPDCDNESAAWQFYDPEEDPRFVPQLEVLHCHTKVSQDGHIYESVCDARLGFPEIRAKFHENLAAKLALHRETKFKVRLKAQVVGILEALKVRIISKGPALEYWAVGVYQKALHAEIKKVSCFRALGRRLCSTDLVDIEQFQFTDNFVKKLGWCSSDFSGASDGTIPYINMRMSNILSGKLSLEDQVIIRQSTEMHTLAYPSSDFDQLMKYWYGLKLITHQHYVNYLYLVKQLEKPESWTTVDTMNQILPSHLQTSKKEHRVLLQQYEIACKARYYASTTNPPKLSTLPFDQGDVVQNSGTLMGSKTSFPLLSLYVLLMHVYNLVMVCGDTRPLDKIIRGVLINGDDRLTVGSSDYEESFDRTIQMFGMRLSPGKSFWHELYANINSQCYLVPLQSNRKTVKASVPIRIPVLNLGLIRGLSGGEKTDDEFRAIDQVSNKIPCINEIMSGCFDTQMQRKVLGLYLNDFKEDISNEARGRNLFLSHGFGGWGVIPPDGWKFNVTLYQRKLGTFLLQNRPCAWVGFGPLPGPTNDHIPTVFLDCWINFRPQPPSYRVPKGTVFSNLLGRKTLMLPIRDCLVNRTRTKKEEKSMPVVTPKFKNCTDRVSKLEFCHNFEPAKEQLQFFESLVFDDVLGNEFVEIIRESGLKVEFF